MKSLLIAVALICLGSAESADYRDSIPNGQNVPNPCFDGWLMNIVDFSLPTAQWTQFMYDFHDANYTWTAMLCADDSDGDGVSNGAELGDPTCAFVPGGSFTATGPPTNPAVCQPFFEPQCVTENYLSHFDVNQYCGGPGQPSTYGYEATEAYGIELHWSQPSVKYTSNPSAMTMSINCNWGSSSLFSSTLPYNSYGIAVPIGMHSESFICNLESCIATSAGTTCAAPVEVAGITAQDPCSSTPCLHGGNCISTTAYKYTCACPRGYDGPICSSVNYTANPCLQCKNSVSCTELGGLNVNCTCSPYYFGSYCEQGPKNCTLASVEERCQTPFSSVMLQPGFLIPNRTVQMQLCSSASASDTCFRQNTQGCPASDMTTNFPNISLHETNRVTCCDAAGPPEDCFLYQTSAYCEGRRSSAAVYGLCPSFDTNFLRNWAIDSTIQQYCILAGHFHDCLRNATSMCMHMDTENKLNETESLMSVCCGSSGPTDACPGRMPCMRQNVTTCPSFNSSVLANVTEARRVQTCGNASAYLTCAKNLTLNCPSGASDLWGTTDTWYRNCCLPPGPTASCPVPVSTCNATVVCMNGGNCTASEGTYSCRCKPGFSGVRCEININECASSPCSSNATCDDRVGFYRCICPVGYRGDFCNIQYFNTCNATVLFGDEALCDYYLQCFTVGAKPTRTQCGLFASTTPLLFDTIGRTCKLPSTFTSPGTSKMTTNCVKPYL